MERNLYEILVPHQTNDGAKIDVEHHRKWDAAVRAISGGLTVTRPVRGQWVFDDRLFEEKVIPCRILATREEIEKVIEITFAHYPDQHCVIAYRLSTEVIVKYRE